jgi:hypothetical protein
MKGFVTGRDIAKKSSARLVETALQAALLGMLTLLVHHEQPLSPVLFMAVGSTFVKAIVIPWLLGNAT